MQDLFAMHRSRQKFDKLQHEWQARERELVERTDRLEADVALVNAAIEENSKLKAEAEAAKKAAAEAAKEAKEVKEALRTCLLDRDYQKEALDLKTALASELQNNLYNRGLKSEQLAAEVQSLKDEKARMLVEHAEELEDVLQNKDSIKIYFYMF